MELNKKIDNIKLEIKQIAIIWLGQAGFFIKDCRGNTVAIDVYLTDSCERVAGFKRLSPSLIEPDQLTVDALLITHNHADHLDVDAVPVMMANNDTILVGPESVFEDCDKMGIDKNRVRKINIGEELTVKEIQIKAVYADHGELAPDALGFLITIDGIRIYFTGDTAYRPENLTEAVKFKPDVIIPPINGAFGNLNSEEAAKLTKDTGAKVCIPCHFWTFREHGSNPQAFYETMQVYASDCQTMFLTPGEVYIYSR